MAVVILWLLLLSKQWNCTKIPSLLSHIHLAVCLFLFPLQSWLNSTWTLALNENRGKFSGVAWIYEAATWFVVIGDGTLLWRAGLPPKGRSPCDLPSDTGNHKGFTARKVMAWLCLSKVYWDLDITPMCYLLFECWEGRRTFIDIACHWWPLWPRYSFKLITAQ